MPDIKLRDGSGVEQTYTGVDTITVPLADGSGNFTYGLTDEELTFSNFHYLINKATYPLLKKDFKRFKFIPNASQSRKVFYDFEYFVNEVREELDLSDITIDASRVTSIYLSYAFNSSDVKKLPVIINANNLAISNASVVTNANYVLTEEEMLTFLNNFTYQVQQSSANSNSSNQNCTFFSGELRNFLNPSNCLKKWHEIINNEQSYSNYTSSPSYDIDKLNYVKELKNIPIPYRNTNAFTSDVHLFGYSAPSFYCTNSVAFATNNGEPYKLNWKNQVFQLNGYLGCYSGSWSDSYFNFAQGYWKEKNNVFYNTTDLEQAKLNYAKLKNQDDWFSFSLARGTYEGKSNVYYNKLFSRYNHDSAVETLNSLPDTSEYLATAGGTNTIKFTGYQGALTDGGAINTLTEEEIAVATAKGWTVTFV